VSSRAAAGRLRAVGRVVRCALIGLGSLVVLVVLTVAAVNTAMELAERRLAGDAELGP
jgi:hypothetical protein